MQENRKNARFSAGDKDVTCRIIFAKTVEIRDISVDGISLKSDKRFEINRGYRIKIEREDEVISLDGVVVWSALNGSIRNANGEIVPIYIAGLRFENIEGEKMVHLKNFVDGHVVGEPMSQRNDGLSALLQDESFHRHVPQDVLPNLPVGYRMKRLNNGGMLVESPHELPVESRVPIELSSPGHKPINLMGKVTYCFAERGVGSLQRYDFGIEFIDVSDTDKERIDKLINSHYPVISIFEPRQGVGEFSSTDPRNTVFQGRLGTPGNDFNASRSESVMNLTIEPNLLDVP
jgi:hypothetical protein